MAIPAMLGAERSSPRKINPKMAALSAPAPRAIGYVSEKSFLSYALASNNTYGKCPQPLMIDHHQAIFGGPSIIVQPARAIKANDPAKTN